MRDVENLTIDEIIIHILDPDRSGSDSSGARSGQSYFGFRPSQTALPRDQDSLLYEYFKNHIRMSLKNPRAVAAKFDEIEPTEPSGLVPGIFDGTLDFVNASREIAAKLYGIIDGDRRTKSCDLVVIRYRAENLHGAQFLAILKIDPSQIFQHEVLKSANGEEYINFVIQTSAFTKEKLQKAAFIQTMTPRHSSYDMILLDTQVRDSSRQDVADYFKTTFLKTVDSLDPHARTQKLYEAILEAESELSPDLTDRERRMLNVHKQALLTSNTVNVDGFVENLPLEEAYRSFIKEKIVVELPDREFSIDPQFGQKLVSRRYFSGDYGLRLTVPADRYDDVITSVDTKTRDELGNPVTRIVIETQKWQELGRR